MVFFMGFDGMYPLVSSNMAGKWTIYQLGSIHQSDFHIVHRGGYTTNQPCSPASIHPKIDPASLRVGFFRRHIWVIPAAQAILGFEYGYSVEEGAGLALTMWEAGKTKSFLSSMIWMYDIEYTHDYVSMT